MLLDELDNLDDAYDSIRKSLRHVDEVNIFLTFAGKRMVDVVDGMDDYAAPRDPVAVRRAKTERKDMARILGVIRSELDALNAAKKSLSVIEKVMAGYVK